MSFNDPDRESQQDLSLWNRFLEGDNDAYSDIYSSHIQRLFNYGTILTTDRDLIKDCIHDVFVKIYNNRAKLTQTDNIFLYLSVALRNTIFNALKKKYGKVEYIDVLDSSTEEEDHSPESFYIEQEEENNKSEIVKFILSKLTTRQREIIYYRFVQGLSVDEISKLTNMNNQSVSNIIQRSLTRIRDFFKKD